MPLTILVSPINHSSHSSSAVSCATGNSAQGMQAGPVRLHQHLVRQRVWSATWRWWHFFSSKNGTHMIYRMVDNGHWWLIMVINDKPLDHETSQGSIGRSSTNDGFLQQAMCDKHRWWTKGAETCNLGIQFCSKLYHHSRSFPLNLASEDLEDISELLRETREEPAFSSPFQSFSSLTRIAQTCS